MRRAIWLNALLAVAVAALGAWVYFKPASDAPADFALSTLKAAEARSMRIERPGASPVSLEKRNGAWIMVTPFVARGDDSRVQRLLEVLEARTPHRLPATDLSRFELDQPQARITIDRQVFSFGMASPVTNEQYVLTEGAVFAVHPRYGSALPARPAEMASPRLLAPSETPLRIETPTFAVEQRDGRWSQVPPAQDPSQDDLLRWVEQWQRATASRVEQYAGDKPRETIHVRLKEGRVLALGVLAREPDLVIARPDEKLQYHFRAEAARRLLAPPGTPPAPPAAKR